MLERHDKQVLAWLADRGESDPSHAPLIVTWDRLLRRARPEGSPGGALDPLAVCELLSFIGGDGSRSETTRFVGFWLTELETEKGAQVLDTLVQLEKEQLSDAQLAQRARDFRAQCLAGRPDLSDVAALEQAWRSFRGQRRSSPFRRPEHPPARTRTRDRASATMRPRQSATCPPGAPAQ